MKLDPCDITPKTIEQLFYQQIRNLTMQSIGAEERMTLIDVQFSDAWTRRTYDLEI